MKTVLLFLLLTVPACAIEVVWKNMTGTNLSVADYKIPAGQITVEWPYATAEITAPSGDPFSLDITNRCEITVTRDQVFQRDLKTSWEWFGDGWRLGVLIFGTFWIFRIVAGIVKADPEAP